MEPKDFRPRLEGFGGIESDAHKEFWSSFFKDREKVSNMIDITRVKRLCNGAVYENYSTDNGGDFPIHGRYKTSFGWNLIAHTSIGKRRGDSIPTLFDLVEEPLIELDPRVWEVLDDKYKSVAMNCDGTWSAFSSHDPTMGDGYWYYSSDTNLGVDINCLKLPKVPLPMWRRTLTKRPGTE